MLRKLLVIGCVVVSSFVANVFAATYDFPMEGSSMVGNPQYHVIEKGETLAAIAKKYDIGFLGLMAANKGVDPFLPQEGYVLTIPSQIILPMVPYEGIVVNLAELRLYYFKPRREKSSYFSCGYRPYWTRYARNGNQN